MSFILFYRFSIKEGPRPRLKGVAGTNTPCALQTVAGTHTGSHHILTTTVGGVITSLPFTEEKTEAQKVQKFARGHAASKR